MFQVPPGVVSNFAMPTDLPGRHLGVAINVLPAKTFLLHLPGFQNALPDFGRTLAWHLSGQVRIFHGGNIDVDINSV